MKITLHKGRIQRALAIVSPVINSKNVLPILGNILIEEGSIRATNLDVHVVVKDCVPKEFPKTLVSYADLKSALSACRSEEIVIEVLANKVVINFDNSKLTSPIEDDANMFPEKPKMPEVREESILPGAFVAQALRSLADLVNFNDASGGLDHGHNCLMFDGQRFVASSNGFGFVVMNADPEIAMPRNEPVRIHQRQVVCMRPGDEGVPVVMSPNHIAWDDISYYFASPSTKTIDYNKVINTFGNLDKDYLQFTFDTSDFLNALRIGELANKYRKTPFVMVTITGGVASITGDSFDKSCDADTRIEVDSLEDASTCLSLVTIPHVVKKIGADQMEMLIHKNHAEPNGYKHWVARFPDKNTVAYLAGFLPLND